MKWECVENRFENLVIWKESIELAKGIFRFSSSVTNSAIKNQIDRAVVSISANIAEGYELNTDKQLVRHLYIAKGSCGEVRSLLILSRELKMGTSDNIEELIQKCSKLSVMIYKFIKSKYVG